MHARPSRPSVTARQRHPDTSVNWRSNSSRGVPCTESSAAQRSVAHDADPGRGAGSSDTLEPGVRAFLRAVRSSISINPPAVSLFIGTICSFLTPGNFKIFTLTILTLTPELFLSSNIFCLLTKIIFCLPTKRNTRQLCRHTSPVRPAKFLLFRTVSYLALKLFHPFVLIPIVCVR